MYLYNQAYKLKTISCFLANQNIKSNDSSNCIYYNGVFIEDKYNIFITNAWKLVFLDSVGKMFNF